jgi:hypothetical protein
MITCNNKRLLLLTDSVHSRNLKVNDLASIVAALRVLCVTRTGCVLNRFPSVPSIFGVVDLRMGFWRIIQMLCYYNFNLILFPLLSFQTSY